jgi:hypothetical protein
MDSWRPAILAAAVGLSALAWMTTPVPPAAAQEAMAPAGRVATPVPDLVWREVPDPAAADTPSPRIGAGDRLRVHVPSASMAGVHGRVAHTWSDSLRLRYDRDRHATLPAASLQRVEVASGRLSRPSGALRGGANGAGVGLLVGLAVGALLWDELGDTGGERWSEALRTTLEGAGAGAMVGATWGFLAPGPRWVLLEGDAIPTALGIALPVARPGVAPGDSVVVQTGAGTGGSPLRRHAGRMLEAGEATLDVVGGDGSVTRISRTEVRVIYVWRGQRDRRSGMADGSTGGSFLGSVAGLGTGLVAWLVARSSEHPHPWRPALITYFGTGVAGAVMGAVWGAREPGDLWERVPAGAP